MLDNSLLRNIALTYGTRLILIALGLICNVFITRSLGVENYGSYVLFLTIVATIVQVSNFGIPASNLYLAAKKNDVSSLLITNSLIFSIFAASTCGIFYKLGLLDFNVDNISPVYLSIAVFLTLFVLLERNVLIGIGGIGKDNFSSIIARVLTTFYLLSYFLSGSLSFDTAVKSYIIFSFLVLFCISYSLYKSDVFLVKPSIRYFIDNFRFNVKSYFTTLFSFLVLKIDLFIISRLLTKTDLGLYSFSVSFVDYVYLLPVVISTVIFQKYSSISSFAERKNIHGKICVLFFTFYLLLIGVVYLVLEYLIFYLFGVAYFPAIDYIQILLVAIYIMGCSTILQQFLVTSGFPSLLVYIWGGALLINVVINVVYIPEYGVYAAAYSTLITYSLVFFLSLLLIQSNNS